MGFIQSTTIVGRWSSRSTQFRWVPWLSRSIGFEKVCSFAWKRSHSQAFLHPCAAQCPSSGSSVHHDWLFQSRNHKTYQILGEVSHNGSCVFFSLSHTHTHFYLVVLIVPIIDLLHVCQDWYQLAAAVSCWPYFDSFWDHQHQPICVICPRVRSHSQCCLSRGSL